VIGKAIVSINQTSHTHGNYQRFSFLSIPWDYPHAMI
jgi:hypothetical protein